MKQLTQSIARRKHRKQGVYGALGPNEVRILVLLPDSLSTSDIQCTLIPTKLDDAPGYRALSYAWGDPSVTQSIVVNGLPFQVTTNLSAALRQLRHHESTVYIWIDAICVNQHDVSERGQQVQFMREIYSRANETTVWLGVSDNESDLAIDLVQLLSEMYQDCLVHKQHNGHVNWERWGRPVSWKVTKEMFALECFLARSWWHRVWIVQEIAVSRSISLHCGNRSFSWVAARQACWLIRFSSFGVMEIFRDVSNSRRVKTSILQGVDRVANIDELRTAFGPKSDRTTVDFRRSMLMLLTSHRPAEASDPRDKYIAMLGLSTQNAFPKTIDVYHKSTRDTYIFATKSIAQHQKNHLCAALNFLDHADRPRYLKDLPSWVPDWSCNLPRHRPLLFWQHNPTKRAVQAVPYNASGGYADIQKREFQFTMISDALKASGILFDAVDGVAANENFPLDLSLEAYFSSQHPRNFSVLQPQFQQNEYPTGEDVYEVLWQTLIAGRNPFGGALPTEKNWSYLTAVLFALPHDAEVFHAERFAKWINSNKSFLICGRSVEQLITERLQSRGPISWTKDIKKELQTLADAVESILSGNRLSITERGYLCLSPCDTMRGDIIAVLFDCDAPIVLRPQGQYYVFVGTCYVHGIMQGEAMNKENISKYASNLFEIR